MISLRASRNAKACNAVDFCIKSVWEKHLTRTDTDYVCEDCKELVEKARKLLQNETDIERGFNETCNVIPIQILRQSCLDLVKRNILEIVKMIKSDMDPTSVCSHLFLCNSAVIDTALATAKLQPLNCSQCNYIQSTIEQKFQSLERVGVLEKMLSLCRDMKPYFESCSSIVTMNFNDFYDSYISSVARKSICHSLSCSQQQFAKEGIIDIYPASDESDPNVPCQLCQQLILHLRELFLTNTTEIEFKNVLVGFCHQMGKFSNQCVEISDQYFDVIYKYLDQGLDANKACVIIGICPRANEHEILENLKQKVEKKHKGSSELGLFKNGTLCTTCEYFVHFLQDALRKQSTDDEIINGMKKTCEELPSKSMQDECKALVDLYGDAILSLLDMQLDPRFICPKIKLCPYAELGLVFLQKNALDDKPTCPFCLLAIQEIRDVMASNKSKQNVENILGKLCSHLSDNLKDQCTDFVAKYSDQIVEMILADFTAEEACTFIKLCTDNQPVYGNFKLTNENFKVNPEPMPMVKNAQCDLCKEIVQIVESRVINRKSKVS